MPRYEFDTEPGYAGEMHLAVQKVAEALLKDKYGTPLRLLEIGVWEGRGACWWLDEVLTHLDSRYTGVDNWTSPVGIPKVSARNFAWHGHKARVIEGDSKTIVPALDCEYDVVVVDGLHTREGCLADLRNCWDKLLPGGVMIVDDYGYPGLPGVAEAVYEWADGRKFDYHVPGVTAVAFRKPERDDGSVQRT